MGKEFVVNDLDDMCAMMCDNIVPEEQYWIFTFGSGMKHEGKYVKIRGTYGSAREKMVERYGTNWAFQYSEKEWNRMENDPQRYWPLETELKEG